MPDKEEGGEAEDGGDPVHSQRAGVGVADVGGQAKAQDPDAHAADHLVDAQRDGEEAVQQAEQTRRWRSPPAKPSR